MERGEYETVQESKKICTECQSNGMKWKNEYAIMGIDTGNIMWCARCRRNMVCSYASLRSNWATLNIIYVRVECGEWTEKILQKKIDYEPNNHNQTVF